MAKATANCTCATCGSTFVAVKRDLYNTKAARDWEEWATRTIDECDECQTKRLQAEAKAQAEADEKNGLPSLIGSEKQVNWAVRIRAEYIRSFNKIAWKAEDNYTAEQVAEVAKPIYDWLLANKISASWWIDNRYSTEKPESAFRLTATVSKEYRAHKERSE